MLARLCLASEVRTDMPFFDSYVKTFERRHSLLKFKPVHCSNNRMKPAT